MMNRAILLLMMALTGLTAACSSPRYRDEGTAITTHGPVDLTRYQGRWYEIARFPNRFEEGCVGVTADYTLNDDATVTVVNTCRKETLDGPVESAEGVATSTSADNDRLEVTFVPWLPFARGDYWILSLTADYSVATIGNPSGTTGWVLARTPTISAAALDSAYAVLRRNGYDTDRIALIEQAPQ